MGVVFMSNKNLTINLEQSITLQIQNSSGGYTEQISSILNVLLVDDSENSIIKVWVKPAKIPIFLYSGTNYQSLDSLTDEQITQEILNRFGNDLENKLNSLLSIR